VACANHDAQTILQWGLQVLLADPANDLSDLFVVVESLQNSYDLFHGHLAKFLSRVIDFRERVDDEDHIR